MTSEISQVDELLHDFEQALADDDFAVSTRRRYRTVVRDFLVWFEQTNHEPFSPERLTPIDLTSYRTALQARQGASSVNVQVAALKAFCAFLVDAKLREENPAAKLKSVGRHQKLAPKSLKPSEAHALLRAAQQATQQPALKYAVTQLLLQTGIREGECAALSIGDLTIGERQGELLVRTGKGNTSRIVPVNASARNALAAYLGRRWGVDPTVKAVAAVWHEHQNEPLFIGQRRQRLGTSGINKIIAGLVESAQPPVPETTSPHTLRHTFAYHYLADNPGDLVGLAALLGHSSLETTRIYVQPQADDLAQRVEQGRLNAY